MYPNFNEYKDTLVEKSETWMLSANDFVNAQPGNNETKLVSAAYIMALNLLEDYHNWIADHASQ